MSSGIWGMVLKAEREKAGLTIDFVASELGYKITAIKRFEGANLRSHTYKNGVPTTYVDKFRQLLERIKKA